MLTPKTKTASISKLVAAAAICTSTVLATTTTFIPESVNAQAQCQCTNYVANRYGLRGFPNAGDWNDGFLQRNGFRQVGPQVGAVVVMEKSFPGADPNFGHVGIVESIAADGRISVRGANQYVGGSLFRESGCNNVRITGFGRSVHGRNDVTFWVR